MDLNAARQALANQIQAVTGLTTFPDIEADPELPCAVIVPGNPLVKYGQTLGGAALGGGVPMAASNITLVVLVLVTAATDYYDFQADLNQYLGFEDSELSIPYALAVDPTLGGAVDWAIPMTATNMQPIDYAGITMYGARINVDISLQ